MTYFKIYNRDRYNFTNQRMYIEVFKKPSSDI